MSKEMQMSIFGWFRIGPASPDAAAESSNQGPEIVPLSAGLNPFVGRWQGSAWGMNTEVVFAPDGRFSAIMQSMSGTTQRSGTYSVLDYRTIKFVDDAPPTGIWLGRIVSPKEELNYYEFLNPGTMILRGSVPPYAPCEYRKVG
jgi:hypothetical protein